MLSMSSFISVTFGSFKKSFQNYSSSSFFKEAFDVVLTRIQEGRLIKMIMAEKNILSNDISREKRLVIFCSEV